VREDFDALRRHLGLAKVNAIGWSNGAMNLILLAAEHPDTIANAIFVHGVASYTAEDNADFAARYPELMQEYAKFLEDAENPELTDQQRTEMMRALWLEKWFPLMTADPDNAPVMLEQLFGGAQFSWAHADYANRESPTFEARDQLPLITARCLVIAGAHDMLRVEKVQELADGLDEAEFVVFRNSGHFAPAEEPELFANVVFTFLGAE
jgi:pimeloyl-ACP methyl ester carboxylesterase